MNFIPDTMLTPGATRSGFIIPFRPGPLPEFESLSSWSVLPTVMTSGPSEVKDPQLGPLPPELKIGIIPTARQAAICCLNQFSPEPPPQALFTKLGRVFAVIMN
jgi:hypothetical protein